MIKKLSSVFLPVFAIILFPIHIWSQNKIAPSNGPALELQIKEINKITVGLENKIDSNLLFPFIEIKINYGEPTEGVPRETSFYFDNTNEKKRLIAVKTWDGFETWGRAGYYFFDENEKIMKHLSVAIGGPAGPYPSRERSAVIFNPEGKIIWKNMESDKNELEQILKLYKLVNVPY